MLRLEKKVNGLRKAVKDNSSYDIKGSEVPSKDMYSKRLRSNQKRSLPAGYCNKNEDSSAC